MPSPWDRQPGEPAKAWAAFQVYRDLGPFERSHQKVVDHLRRPMGYLRTVEGWSSGWSWVDRSRAWDDHQDQVRQKTLAREVEAMASRHAKTALTMMQLADLKLQSVLRQVDAQVTASGGRSFDVPGLSLAHLPVLVKIASELERLSRGQPATSTEVRSAEALMIPAVLPAEDFAFLVERLRKAGRLPGQDTT